MLCGTNEERISSTHEAHQPSPIRSTISDAPGRRNTAAQEPLQGPNRAPRPAIFWERFSQVERFELTIDVGPVWAAMSDAEQPIPELYREAAEQVRQLARQARLTDIRSDLSKLAARFERLASDADAAIRLGPGSSPQGEVVTNKRDRPPPKERE